MSDINPVKIWSDVKTDLVAGVTSFSQSITMGDIMNDGDSKLICGDITSKVKVFKQECLINETQLKCCPVGVITYKAYDKNLKTLIQYMAVAGGSNIYIYKNMKGVFKLLVPNVEINAVEAQIWEDLKNKTIDGLVAIEKLKDLLINQKISLTTRSTELLSLKDEFQMRQYITENCLQPIVMAQHITTMGMIKKYNPEEDDTPSQIIIGTEAKVVFIIDGSECKILTKHKVDGIPNAICSFGSYDADYLIYVACRNEIIYVIKNGSVSDTIIQVSSKIVNMFRFEKGLYVACMNSYYHNYSTNGKKLFSFKQPSEIYCLEPCDLYKIRKFRGILLGLKNSEIRLYNDRILVGVISIPEVIFGIKFGKIGKINECLVIVSEKGSIYLKQLEKNVNLDTTSFKKVVLGLEENTLKIPKKTTTFLELMEREKEFYKGMYNSFQTDLTKLKFKTLDTYSKLIVKGYAPQNYSTVSSVKLNVSLQGLGPNFRLSITVDNSGEEIINSVDLIVDYDKNIFEFPKESIQLGLIMPHIPTKHTLSFRNISDNGVSGILNIMILDKTSSSPLIVSNIKVPISELEIF